MIQLLNKFFSKGDEAALQQTARLQKMRRSDSCTTQPHVEKKCLSESIQATRTEAGTAWKQETVTEEQRRQEIANMAGLKNKKSYLACGDKGLEEAGSNLANWLY